VGVCQAGSCCIPLTERRAICALNLLCGGSHTNLADGCGGTISATISCQRDDCPATHPDCPRGGPNQGQCKMQ
jgi:hypothetical protein